MQNITQYFGAIESELAKRRVYLISVIVCSCILILGTTLIQMHALRRERSTVYVLDKGYSFAAMKAPDKQYRDLEADNHLRRFHEAVFNLAPTSESQARGLEKALAMADRSVYNWWQDQSESGYFQRLVSANISQEIEIDSVSIDMGSYPHPARLFGKLFLVRESNISSYEIETSCTLCDVQRSPGNPGGLMIEKFAISRYSLLGTRPRR